jgi:hypothetical protein
MRAIVMPRQNLAVRRRARFPIFGSKAPASLRLTNARIEHLENDDLARRYGKNRLPSARIRSCNGIAANRLMRNFIIFSLCLFAFSAVQAADPTQEALSEIVRCAGITDAGERLKCFDAAAPNAKKALAEHEAQEKRGILDWFGFSRPRKPVTKPEEFGKPQPPSPTLPGGEITQIKATVIEFALTPRGKALWVLDNGQVWRQLDADDTRVLAPDPGKPMKVTIEIGFLESYNLLIEGRNGLIKVRRLK